LDGTTLRRGRTEALAPQGRQPDPARYHEAPHRGQALLTTNARAAQRERATTSPAAIERQSYRTGAAGAEDAMSSGATAREAQEESAQVGARQAAGVASAACGGKRSRRMVALGRRIGGGGVSAETAAVSNAANGGHGAKPKRRSGGCDRSVSKNSGASRHRGVAECPRWNAEGETETRPRGKASPAAHTQSGIRPVKKSNCDARLTLGLSARRVFGKC
jgi:Type IV secretory pathway, TrbL components